MTALRIVVVGPLPPPSGGMANQTAQLARLLRTDGHVVHEVRSNAPYCPRWLGGLRGLRAVARLLPYCAELWRRSAAADVLHVMANSGWSWHLFAAPAVWIGWLRGVPVVINYRGGEAAAFLRSSMRWMRPTLRRAAALIVPSAFLRDVFAGHDVAAEIVPNVVDLARFAPATARRERGAHIVITRNLEAIYGIDTALRAFAEVRAELPQARLTVAGDGPERKVLEALAARLGVAGPVNFCGSLSPADMPALYADADLLLNPARVDNAPNALLEAWASGVPVVSTDAGGIPFIVEPGRTALLVSVGDASALGSAALAVLRDDALAAALRRHGLEAARRHAWASVRPLLLAVYARVMHPPVQDSISA